MGGISIALVATLLGAPAANATVPSETVLISGRVRLAQKSQIDSRKFEVILQRRNDATVTAQACLYADLEEDVDWDGDCYPLTFLAGDESIARLALSTREISPVDAPAQRLLRMLTADTDHQRLPARRIVGFDPGAPITVYSTRFSEADL